MIENINIKTALSLFLREQVFRNNSPRTLEWYTTQVNHFIEWLGTDDISALNLDNYKSYTIYLNTSTKKDGKPYKSSSLNNFVRAVKGFYNFCIGENFIPDISRKLRTIHVQKEEQTILDDYEIDKLINFKSKSLQSVRNHCILVLMLDTGLRRGEVPKLCIGDVDLENSVLLVNGKGRKQRFVPMGNLSQKLMLSYKTKYRRFAPDNAPFFVNRYGDSMTDNTMKMLFQDLKNEIGILRLHPHLLRHTFATHYLMDGGDLETLRCILGHSDLKITEVYLHIASNYKIIHDRHISHLDILNEDTKKAKRKDYKNSA